MFIVDTVIGLLCTSFLWTIIKHYTIVSLYKFTVWQVGQTSQICVELNRYFFTFICSKNLVEKNSRSNATKTINAGHKHGAFPCTECSAYCEVHALLLLPSSVISADCLESYYTWIVKRLPMQSMVGSSPKLIPLYQLSFLDVPLPSGKQTRATRFTNTNALLEPT